MKKNKKMEKEKREKENMENEKRQKAIHQLKKIKKLVEGKKIKLASEWKQKWQILISAILSPKTKDEITIAVANKLFRKYKSIQKLAEADVSDIEKIIKPVNFYKTKAKRVIEVAKIISKQIKKTKQIPKTKEELLKLPGVGRKVANVYLMHAHKIPAIAVDTHVAFLSRALGWTKNKDPYKIEKDLEILFPKKYWNVINRALVKFGRLYPSRKKQIEKLKDEGIL